MKKLTFISFVFLLSSCVYSQNITTTLGTGGVFSLKNGSTTFLSLSEADSVLNVNYKLTLPNTTSPGAGVIYKGTNRFLHNYGTNNTFLGVNSGNFTMTGNDNSAFGFQALYSNTTGYENSAFGYRSLYSNTTGYFNSAFGYRSLDNNTTGYYNTAAGHASLYNNTTGYMNTAFGMQSLHFNTTGYNNTAFGMQSLHFNTTGINNTVFGVASGNTISTGNNNIAIGFDTQVPSGTSSNQVRIGNTSISYAGIQVAWTITSDRRWKDNILPSSLGLSFITKLNPVSYRRWNDESKKTEYGLIAQEVEEAIKQEGIENPAMITIDDNGNYELRYNDLIAPMIKAIQELNQKCERLQAENNSLNSELESMKELKEKLAELEKSHLELIKIIGTEISKESKIINTSAVK